jgi:hypothetical protein
VLAELVRLDVAKMARMGWLPVRRVHAGIVAQNVPVRASAELATVLRAMVTGRRWRASSPASHAKVIMAQT